MNPKESPTKNLPTEPVLSPQCKTHKISKVPKDLLPSMPAKYKGWSCKLYVVWMHCQN